MVAVNEPSSLVQFLLQEIEVQIPNIEVPHCSFPCTFIQIWKKNWNNNGKTGVHIQLDPTKEKSFLNMFGKEFFKITIALHNESTTQKLGVEIPEKFARTREYSFLKEDRVNSVNMLIKDVKRFLSEVEQDVDDAFEKIK